MKRWALVIGVSAIVLFLSLINHQASAETGPSWFVSGNPGITEVEQNATSPKISYWGAPCRDQTFDATWFSSSTYVTQEVTSCVNRAPYGDISNYGVKVSGTDTSYGFRSASNSPISLYPVPGSKHVMSFSQTGSSQYKYVYLYKNLTNNIRAVSGVDGTTQYYQLTEPHDGVANRVLLPDNSRAIVQDQSLTYSGEGQYIFANMGRAQVLVDTETNAARLIGGSTNPSSGNPKVNLAISDTGTSVFVADNNRGTYKLYNTQACTPASSLSNPEVCTSKDITQVIHSAVSGIKLVAGANFLSDNKLELYIVHSTDTGYRSDKYIITAPGYTESSMPYLALGDSFASGEGAQSYLSKTNNENNHCHISEVSYPYLIKDDLEYDAAESIACSGGKMKDVYESKEKEYKDDYPQANGKTTAEFDEEIYAGYLPGYRRQYEFVQKYKPESITVSISGNDINFGKKLQYCILTQYSCYESAGQKQNILKEIRAQFPKLVKTYEDLKRASPETRIYVVGYPQLVLPGGNCALNVPLSSAELMLADEITEDLNTMIKRATQSAGVQFVDTSDAFSGHRLCENDSWNLAVNGVTFDGWRRAQIGPVPLLAPNQSPSFHPNVMGHQFFRDTILAQTSNLTDPMPAPDDTISVDDMPSRLSPTGDTTGTDTTPILEDGLFGDLVQIGDRLSSLVTTAGYYLSAGSEYSVEIHSTPTVIGTATATDSETLSIDAQIPEGVEPGPHEVHIYGEDIAGEPIDIYKNIIVIAGENDYDGDGIDNAADQCMFVDPSGIDSDNDGVDDRCDIEVGEPVIVDTDNENDSGVPSETGSSIPVINQPSGVFGAVVAALKQTAWRPFGRQVSKIAKAKTAQKATAKLAKDDWRKTALILLTSTPLGIILVILIDL